MCDSIDRFQWDYPCTYGGKSVHAVGTVHKSVFQTTDSIKRIYSIFIFGEDSATLPYLGATQTLGLMGFEPMTHGL